MAKKKWKKLAKNVGKAAVLAGALYGASKLKGGLKGRADKLTEGDIGLGLRPPRVDDYNYKPKKVVENFDPNFLALGAAKGGRIGKKGGGIAKRGIGAAYKSGGRVKSMGIAKRGGGIAKR